MSAGRVWTSILPLGGVLLAMLVFACGEAPVPEEVAQRPARETRPGIRFDPATVRPGDSVGVLVVDTIVAGPNVVDSTLVGMARFRGRIELGGRIIPHPDDNLRGERVCFEADEASAARMPRWLHDERRAWFCFSNPGEAAAALGPAAGDAGVTVVIDDFTIHRGLSDEVNSARFVGRAGTGPPAR